MLERMLGVRERRYIEALKEATGSNALDCISDDRFDRVIYVIRPGEMGLAIGSRGENIRKLERALGKRVEMVEYAENMEDFLRNIFRPLVITGMRRCEDDRSIEILLEKRSELGIAIGKGGANAEKARILLERYFGLGLKGIRVLHERERG